MKQRDTCDTKTKGIEKQYHKRMTQFMEHYTWCIQPEPDHQASLTPESIANLVNTPAQSLACKSK
jgi:hypothetical protein